MSRYQYKEAREVLESYEWLYREKLEELDVLTRKMWRDLQTARTPKAQIPVMIGEFFRELWVQVAEEQEQKAKYRRNEP